MSYTTTTTTQNPMSGFLGAGYEQAARNNNNIKILLESAQKIEGQAEGLKAENEELARKLKRANEQIEADEKAKLERQKEREEFRRETLKEVKELSAQVDGLTKENYHLRQDVSDLKRKETTAGRTAQKAAEQAEKTRRALARKPLPTVQFQQVTFTPAPPVYQSQPTFTGNSIMRNYGFKTN